MLSPSKLKKPDLNGNTGTSYISCIKPTQKHHSNALKAQPEHSYAYEKSLHDFSIGETPEGLVTLLSSNGIKDAKAVISYLYSTQGMKIDLYTTYIFNRKKLIQDCSEIQEKLLMLDLAAYPHLLLFFLIKQHTSQTEHYEQELMRALEINQPELKAIINITPQKALSIIAELSIEQPLNSQTKILFKQRFIPKPIPTSKPNHKIQFPESLSIYQNNLASLFDCGQKCNPEDSKLLLKTLGFQQNDILSEILRWLPAPLSGYIPQFTHTLTKAKLQYQHIASIAFALKNKDWSNNPTLAFILSFRAHTNQCFSESNFNAVLKHTLKFSDKEISILRLSQYRVLEEINAIHSMEDLARLSNSDYISYTRQACKKVLMSEDCRNVLALI